MKKAASLMLAVLMVTMAVLPLWAAGQTEAPASTAPTAVKPSDLKIALLLPSSPADGGWGQVGSSGLRAAIQKYGFREVIIEARTADLMKVEAETLAQEGYHIIFGHGGQYSVPFSEISAKYPNTFFVTAGGSKMSDNQLMIEFVLERLNYIQGVMAARLTKSKKIGLVIGGGFPAYTKTSRAFTLGVKSVDPNIEVMLGVTQNAADMNEGYELTKSQINAGADIVWSNANQATLGCISAAKDNNILYFGAVNDASREAPNQIIATAAQNFLVAYTLVIDRFLAGTLKGARTVMVSVPEGGIFWVWNEPVKNRLPPEVVKLYEELLPKVLSGEINVPRENEGW